jgi:hypothetical protein
MIFFNKTKKASRNTGSMMVEVVVVISIITMLVVSASAVAQRAISMSRQSVHRSQASFLLEEGAEATRIIRDNAWSSITNLSTATDYYLSFSGGTWILSTTPTQDGIFTRKVVLSPVYRDVNQNIASSGTLDDQTRLITVTVTWAEGDNIYTKTLQLYLSDIFSS